MMSKILLLWLIFDLKHYIADFVLQTNYMQGKFQKSGWQAPLALHCSMHAICTLLIVLAFSPVMWWLSILDFAIHFTMDRIKASTHLLGRFKNLCQHEMPTATVAQKRHDRLFWLALGFDQYIHHLTNLLIVWILLSFG